MKYLFLSNETVKWPRAAAKRRRAESIDTYLEGRQDVAAATYLSRTTLALSMRFDVR